MSAAPPGPPTPDPPSGGGRDDPPRAGATAPSASERAPWTVVRALVEDALDVARPEREAHVRAHAPNEAAADEALELLRHAKGETTTEQRFTQAARVASGGTSPAAPGRLGPWEVRRRIGRGGMADVWLAVRADGLYQRRVAIKRLHPSLANDETVARFERERQILANLSHPGIAKMLDAGSDGDGVPYLVMEYVDGQRIDDYADERHLGVRERVELLVRVADAAMAAHRMHVVHRDIKPSNVLVDRDGRPVLLDFGVAKVLDPEKDAGAMVTRDVARFLTPNYASPEQAAGLVPTETSDVYSLGALAYELLAGRPPLEVAGRSAFDAAERIAHETPPRLAEALRQSTDADAIARARGTSAAKLTAELDDRDLEAILAAALRKEPARRPPDAGALRAEFERWLAGEPVLSRRDSWVRGALRLAARHRVVFALAGALLVSLVLGLVLVAREARRANRTAEALALETQRAEAQLVDLRNAMRVLMRDSVQSFGGIPGTERGLQRLIRGGMAIAKRQDDPTLQLQFAHTRFDYESLEAERRGFRPEGVDRMQEAAATIDALVAPKGGARAYPPLLQVRTMLARAQCSIGRLDAAGRTFREGLEDLAALPRETRYERANVLANELVLQVERCEWLRRTGEHRLALEAVDATLRELELARREEPMLRAEASEVPVEESVSAGNRGWEVVRGTALDAEARLERLRASIAGPRSAESLVRTAERSAAIGSAHSANRVVEHNSQVEVLSAVQRLVEAGAHDEAVQLFGSIDAWAPTYARRAELDHLGLFLLLEKLRVAAFLEVATGTSNADAFPAYRRVAEEFAEAFGPTYLTRVQTADMQYLSGLAAEASGDRMAAALALAEAARGFADLSQESPRDSEVSLSRCEAEVALARVLHGEPSFASREAPVRAALDAFVGDELAARWHAPLVSEARELFGWD